MTTEPDSDLDSFVNGLLSSQTFVLFGTRDGPTRFKIVEALEDETHTVDELAMELGENTCMLREQLDVLDDNNIVETDSRPENTRFVLSDQVSASLEG